MVNENAVRADLKAELLHRLQAFRLEQALFPSDDRSLMPLIEHLEQLNPTPHPLAAAHRSELWGVWNLVYASQGTVVTRRIAPLNQGILAGIKIERIWQQLAPGEDCTLQVQNGAILEFPWLGSWQLQADGTWFWEEIEQQTARVSFTAFSIQAVSLFGQSQWQLPELKIPVLEALRNEALWTTSYLDADLRIGRGATGNLFVFRAKGNC